MNSRIALRFLTSVAFFMRRRVSVCKSRTRAHLGASSNLPFSLSAKSLILVASLLCVGACATSPISSAHSETTDKQSNQVSASEALRPYLGKWRPTSYSEGLNIGSLTITEKGLSLETGPSLTYEIVEQTDEGVLLHVTSSEPDDRFRGVKALAFSLEIHVIPSFPPGGPPKKRQDLWIYWCDGLGRLALGISKASCSKNGYMR